MASLRNGEPILIARLVGSSHVKLVRMVSQGVSGRFALRLIARPITRVAVPGIGVFRSTGQAHSAALAVKTPRSGPVPGRPRTVALTERIWHRSPHWCVQH